MPNSPGHRTTRSNSNTPTITLLDIKTLIENTKTDILDNVRTEVEKLSDLFATLVNRIDNLEKRNAMMDQKYSENIDRLNEEVKQLRLEKQKMKNEFLNEMEQRNNRRGNIIISGIPENIDGTADERKDKDREIVEDI